MKKTLIAAIVAAMVSAPTWSQTASIDGTSGMGLLQNISVKAGVNTNVGTLGSGGGTSPGLLFDPTGSGTFNPSFDYLTPGSPFDGFALKVDSENKTNNNTGIEQITGQGLTLSNSDTTLTWTGSAAYGGNNWSIANAYTLGVGKPYIDITTTITAGGAATDVWFAKFIDPDSQGMPGDSSATDNVLGYGVIPSSNVAFSEATVSRYALGLYSAATNVDAGITGWTTDAASYTSADTTCGSGVLYCNGDDTIGLTFHWSGVAAGDILTASYAYIFGPSAFAAADSAVDGGAGGGTPGTAPGGGTLVDVGSATSAASSSSTPTVTGTTTTTVTISDTTVINPSLPVLTASIAHHEATETAAVQTIARETNTNVTTPHTRIVTTVDRTVTTYSDSTTTTSDSAPTSTSTLVNVVTTSVANDSFSGRIDQDAELAKLNKQLDRSLNMDVFRKDGVTKDDVTVYINGRYTDSNMSNGYSATTEGFGLSAEKQIDADWRLGVQGNRITTKISGVDSNIKQDKDHLGVYSVYDIEGFTVVNNLGHSMNTGKSNRSIAGIDFSNSHDIKGTDTWLNNRVYAPEIEGVRAFAGATVGQSKVNGYTESGSIQSARTVSAANNDYSYGEAGVRFDRAVDEFKISGEIGRTTDSVNTAAVILGYVPNKDSLITVGVNYQKGDNIESTTATIKGILRF